MDALRSISLLEAITRPRGVAIIHAEGQAALLAAMAAGHLARHGFSGPVHSLIARNGDLRRESWALPPIDHAFVVAGGDAALAAVDACGEARIPVATMWPDPDGAAADERVRDAARQRNVRLIGPNAGGVVVPGTGLVISADPIFATPALPAGRTMLLCQSGGILASLFSRAAARHRGFAAMVSAGDESDLSLGEIGAAAVDDPEIDSFVLVIEALRHAAHLARFAAKAHAAGKPIVAHQLYDVRPRSDLGPLHQAARSSVEEAANAFFDGHGVARVGDIESLFELPKLLMHRRRQRGRAAIVVDATGGAGLFVADRLKRLGVVVAGLDELARRRLAANDIASIGAGPLVELRPEAVSADRLSALLREAQQAPNNDIVVAAVNASAPSDPGLWLRALSAAAARTEKPVIAFVATTAPDLLRAFGEAGIAAFTTPDAAADAVRAWLNCEPLSAPPFFWSDAAPAVLRGATRALHEGQAAQILRLLGINLPTMLWIKAGAPIPPQLPFPPPYAVKVLSPNLPNRGQFGGIALGLETVTMVRLAAQTVTRRAREVAPRARIDGVMIARMETSLAEVALLFRRDSGAGPTVTLAMGGALRDVYDDSAVRLAPVDRPAALAMIGSIKGLMRLRGFRSGARGDVDALADAIVKFSTLALISSPAIIEAEIDPLFVREQGKGVVAVDAWIRSE